MPRRRPPPPRIRHRRAAIRPRCECRRRHRRRGSAASRTPYRSPAPKPYRSLDRPGFETKQPAPACAVRTGKQSNGEPAASCTRVGSARAGIPRASTAVDVIDGPRVCPGPHPICRFERPFAERRIVWGRRSHRDRARTADQRSGHCAVAMSVVRAVIPESATAPGIGAPSPATVSVRRRNRLSG